MIKNMIGYKDMTVAQRERVGMLVEDGVSDLPVLRAEMNGAFGECFTGEAIRKARSDYLINRLGSVYYSQKKLDAFRAFDRGETVDEAAEFAGCTLDAARDYRRAWVLLHGNDAEDAMARHRHGIRAGSGTMFGEDTRRDTIWLTA